MNSEETIPVIKHLKLPTKGNSTTSILSVRSKADSIENSARKSSFQKGRSNSGISTPKVLTFEGDKNLATRLNDSMKVKLQNSDNF